MTTETEIFDLVMIGEKARPMEILRATDDNGRFKFTNHELATMEDRTLKLLNMLQGEQARRKQDASKPRTREIPNFFVDQARDCIAEFVQSACNCYDHADLANLDTDEAVEMVHSWAAKFVDRSLPGKPALTKAVEELKSVEVGS